MISVQFLNPEKYGEAYWYCRMYLLTWEWEIDYNYQYRLNFANEEAATFIRLRYT